MKAIGIIPCRYGSTRFPGKPLIDILGKSMIQRVHEQSIKSTKLSDLIIATDDSKIFNHVLEFGGKVVMTSKNHNTGTERCNEAFKKIKDTFDIVINIQGDEPFINPLQIDQVIQLFKDPKTEIGTLAKEITDIQTIKDYNTPKAIFDKSGNALNFCRKIIPNSKQKTYKHIGIYGYRKNILNQICQLPKSKNEIKESLEQLRWLDNNYKIKVGITRFQTLSIDTPDDIEKIKDEII